MFFTAIVNRTNKTILYPEEHKTSERAQRRLEVLKGHVVHGRQLGDPLMVEGHKFELYQGEQPFHFPTAEEEAAAAAEAEARLAEQIRAQRNTMLVNSDWTQAVSDSPLTEAQRKKWKTYRQALRDLPQQEGFPSTVEWPAKPE